MKAKMPRCTYCRKPAVTFFRYRGYLVRAGRAPVQPVRIWAACSEHAGCANYIGTLKIYTERGRIIEHQEVA